MSSAPATSVTGYARRKRLKIGVACQACRSKKAKCDGMRPACGNCQKKDRGRGCNYISSTGNAVPTPSQSGPRALGSRDADLGKGSIEREASFPKIPSGIQNGRLPIYQASAVSLNTDAINQPRAPESYFGGSPRVFAGEVSAAVHARFGAPVCGGPSLSPMTDAPLFGFFSYQRNFNHDQEVENVLPPRRHADHLMDIYWRRLQPLEPILDETQFKELYKTCFAASLPEKEDERTFLATLNVVFALATQADETLHSVQRERAGNTYFHRAWSLLRPETVIWEPGSLEIVECLLLMSRFLQCTNDPHRTWMVVGSAVRIAQSLGFQVRAANSSSVSKPHTRRGERLWQCCVFVERAISWAQGRSSNVILSDSYLHSERAKDDDYFAKTLEIYEIFTHITMSQISFSSTWEARLGLPVLYKKDDYYSDVMRFETCIARWQKDLPKALAPELGVPNEDTPLSRQKIALHLRLLHARIVLFRPLLGRLCLAPLRDSQDESDSRLRDSLIQDGGSLCIQAAQDMIRIVVACIKSEILGMLPWWHRIFYLHIGGTILLATMLRQDLWNPAVKQSWEDTLSAFHAMEHINPFVKQCFQHFQMLSNKVLETHQSSVDVPVDGIYFQDFFRDIGFDQDIYSFGKEDMSWLGTLETSS